MESRYDADVINTMTIDSVNSICVNKTHDDTRASEDDGSCSI